MIKEYKKKEESKEENIIQKNNTKVIQEEERKNVGEIIKNDIINQDKNIVKKEEEYTIEKFYDWEDNNSLFFSVILIGDTEVGKSWIFDKFFGMEYTKSSSICMESEEICIKINDDILSLSIQDIPGKDIFFKLNLESSIIKQDLIIFVYSIDNKKSFETITKRIKEVKEKCGDNTHCLLVGNKLDLKDNRKVSAEEGSELAKNEKLDFFMEVSALTGENIDKIFFEGAKILYKNRE
jgi:Ras-related protein Rab-1A